MKGLEDILAPEDVFFSEDHTWAKKVGDVIRVGISDFAQDQMGDIVYVELPTIGSSLGADEEYGVIESVKTVSDCLMPIAGEIVTVNDALDGSPGLVNESPYDEGWMMEVKPDDPDCLDTLMDAVAYRIYLQKS